jgi:WS/DGAT/MGAT family acyltransferase
MGNDSTQPSSSEKVGALDYLLYRGDHDPATRSTILGIEVLDTTPDWRRFRAVFDRASRSIVRLRQKIVEPTLPTTSARWVVDPDFDLDFHVRRMRAPRPGSLREVLDFAEVLLQSRLDPGRPLWAVTLVEELAEGGSAVVFHASHAVSDGVGAMELFAELYDPERDAPAKEIPLQPIPHELSGNSLMLNGLMELPGALTRATGSALSQAASAVTNAVRNPGSTMSALDYLQSAGRVMGRAGQPSALLAGRSLRTRSDALTMPLAGLRAAGKAAGGSVNDAYLAGLCGALRLYHEAMGYPVPDLPMAVPLSIRADGDPRGGNRFTAVNVCAPVGEADPALRIKAFSTDIARGRSEPALGIVDALIPVMAVVPKAVLNTVSGAMLSADVQATNVAGDPGDTYLAGAKVLSQYGIGPLPGVAMMTALVSRAGVCTVTVRYDLAAVRDVETFRGCLVAGFAEVLALGDGGEPRID